MPRTLVLAPVLLFGCVADPAVDESVPVCAPSFARSEVASLPGAHAVAAAAGDLDGDSRADLVVTATLPAEPGLFGVLLRGATAFAQPVVYRAPMCASCADPRAAAVGDLDGNGALDVVIASRSDDGLSVYLGTRGARFDAPGASYASAIGPVFDIALGDVDGNGRLDVLAVTGTAVRVFRNVGAGALELLPQALPCGRSCNAVAVGDLDGDGLADVVATSYHDHTATVFLGTPSGNLGAGTAVATAFYPSAVALGDLDADGAPELVVASTNTIGVLANDGAAGFVEQHRHEAAGQPAALALGDFDGDGSPDIAVADALGDTVTVLRNAGDGAFTLSGHAGTRGPTSLVAADLAGDGKLDLAVTSFDDGAVTVLANTTSCR